VFGNWCGLEVHLFFLVTCYNGTSAFMKLNSTLVCISWYRWKI